MSPLSSLPDNASRSFVLAGIVSVPIGLLNLVYPPAVEESVWGYPYHPEVHVGISIVLVVAHLLKVPGFLGLAQLEGAPGTVRWSMRLAALGFVVVALCEAVSAYLVGVPVDSPAAVSLNDGYGVGSMLGALPSVIGGWIIARKNLLSGFGRWSVLLSGAFMIFVVTPALIMGRGPAAYLALTVWSLFFIWIGRTLGRTSQA